FDCDRLANSSHRVCAPANERPTGTLECGDSAGPGFRKQQYRVYQAANCDLILSSEPMKQYSTCMAPVSHAYQRIREPCRMDSRPLEVVLIHLKPQFESNCRKSFTSFRGWGRSAVTCHLVLN